MGFLGQDTTAQDSTKTSFPINGVPQNQDWTKTSFPIMQIRQSAQKIAKFHRKNHQTLRPNADSPLRVCDSKEWYCAAATTWRPAASTSAIVASKQRTWAKEAAHKEYENFTEQTT